jgi:mannose-6-phosphate isomerase
MKQIAYLKNTIQEYPWGSRTAIAALMGQPSPTDRPQAELWMGAHPKAPSLVLIGNDRVSLANLIRENPADILGQWVTEKYHATLPFLFKVLAAAQPLSIQAHPDLTAARAGYAREERRNVPFNAPERNYKDPNHKPECLCALTSFWGLCGFRAVSEAASLLGRLCPDSLGDALCLLEKPTQAIGMRTFFQAIMGLSFKNQAQVVNEAVRHAKAMKQTPPECDWLIKLSHAYPNDIGVIFPAILNLVHLEPGQSLFLGPGELHAYLSGVGIEIMANSDNVLRGGLTSKHRDVDELMRNVSFEEKVVDILLAENQDNHMGSYRTPAEEFELSVITLDTGHTHTGQVDRSVEILLCTAGEHIITDTGNRNSLTLNKGDSVLIPAAVTGYAIEGKGVIYRAAVPLM